MTDQYDFKVRGVSYHAEAVDAMSEKERVYIRNEVNDKDPEGHALGIYSADNDLLGFAGGDDRGPIRQILKNKYKATIVKKSAWKKDDGSKGATGLKVRVVKASS